MVRVPCVYLFTTSMCFSPGYVYFNLTKFRARSYLKHIRSLPPEVKRRSVLVALEATRVKLQEVIEDAVRRDCALDTFELYSSAASKSWKRGRIGRIVRSRPRWIAWWPNIDLTGTFCTKWKEREST